MSCYFFVSIIILFVAFLGPLLILGPSNPYPFCPLISALAYTTLNPNEKSQRQGHSKHLKHNSVREELKGENRNRERIRNPEKSLVRNLFYFTISASVLSHKAFKKKSDTTLVSMHYITFSGGSETPYWQELSISLCLVMLML